MKTMKFAGAFAALALTAGMATAASADTYNLNVSAAFPNGVTYGVVTTTQNGANVDVSVVLSSGFHFVKTGNHDSFTFNSNDSTLSASDVVSIAPNTVSAFSPGSNPAFGSYSIGMECGSCGNGGAGQLGGTLAFTVLNTNLSNFVNNASGYVFSADIIGDGVTGAVGAGVTGGAPGVPEPATWAMMIMGMGMVGAGMRMRRHNVATLA
jgi:hypothetical protein